MGIYSRYIFPRLVNWEMSREVHSEQRKRVLAAARGPVLEIGFGTGLNLPHYPATIESLTAIDNNPGMKDFAETKSGTAPFPVRLLTLDGARLPMADASFQTAVSTWTLCSVTAVDRALAEIRRVLVPGGVFLFIEHGLSDDPKIQRWQHRLNPINRLVGGGCNINRNVQQLVEAAGLQIQEIDRFNMEGSSRITGYTYRGLAIR